MVYKVEFEVRDNEIDAQGIVSNVVYPIYMAHARHKFLRDVLKMDFLTMSQAKQNIILTSTTIEFKKPLKPYDKFYVTCSMAKKGRIRFIFEQEVRLISDDSLIAKGELVGVCMDGNKNKPFVPDFPSEYIGI